jgi:hypothetical protein
MLCWVPAPFSSLAELEPMLRDAQLYALIRAVEFYLHADVSEAFPGDDICLATFIEQLKRLGERDAELHQKASG